MLLHIVTCSNYFDLNKTVALRNGGQQKTLIFWVKFSHKFSSNLSISLVQNILSLLDNQENLSHVLDTGCLKKKL